ncbi:uncharacterized protein LOC132549927 [Ylistrum balloti]|uniref:uncharacterized protein LOC132549927 n=1 Tax=Ylistrum balloti TaxID=509963 RepID=UPI002905BA8F|nr:uncharacterized protein LOC132549927 [Ylistrum balloti]
MSDLLKPTTCTDQDVTDVVENSVASSVAECPFFDLNDNSDTTKQTNSSHSLDKYLQGDFFQSSFDDMSSETKPKDYTGIFSDDINDMDEASTSHSATPNLVTADHLGSTVYPRIAKSPSLSYSLNESGRLECPRALNCYFRSDSIFNVINENNETCSLNQAENSKTEDMDFEEHDNDPFEARDDSAPESPSYVENYHVSGANQIYLEKLKELEREINQLEILQKHQTRREEGKATGVSDTGRRKLSTQRSVSESDVYDLVNGEEIESNSYLNTENSIQNKKCDLIKISRTEDIKMPRSNDGFGIKRWSSFKNIKTVWKRLTKTESKALQININEDSRTNVSCPCDGACQRVGSLVTTLGGFIWIAFSQCSWMGQVDCLAVSKIGVLYVSCPSQRRILMVGTDLEVSTLAALQSLYPRGLAVSPVDGAIIACMTTQKGGCEMNAQSQKSCLMRFKGETQKPSGKIISQQYCFGYPLKIVINCDGFLLVSDFGLRCLFILDKDGNMLRTLSRLGGSPLDRVHSLVCNPGNSFFVVQGGAGRLSITRLKELEGHSGIFEEESTTTKDEPFIDQTIFTSSRNDTGHIVVANGQTIFYVSLVG